MTLTATQSIFVALIYVIGVLCGFLAARVNQDLNRRHMGLIDDNPPLADPPMRTPATARKQTLEQATGIDKICCRMTDSPHRRRNSETNCDDCPGPFVPPVGYPDGSPRQTFKGNARLCCRETDYRKASNEDCDNCPLPIYPARWPKNG
jgi:hypothetical protein